MKRSFHKFRHWTVVLNRDGLRGRKIKYFYRGRFHQGKFYLGHPVPGPPKTKSRSIQGEIWFLCWSDPDNMRSSSAHYYYECQIQDHNNCIRSVHTGLNQTIDKCFTVVLKC